MGLAAAGSAGEDPGALLREAVGPLQAVHLPKNGEPRIWFQDLGFLLAPPCFPQIAKKPKRSSHKETT